MEVGEVPKGIRWTAEAGGPPKVRIGGVNGRGRGPTGIAYHFIVGVLLIYRKRFTNPFSSFFEKNLLFLGTKSIFPYQRLILPYQGLIFREIRDLETRKFMDKYFLCISRLYPFVHRELAISRRTAG